MSVVKELVRRRGTVGLTDAVQKQSRPQLGEVAAMRRLEYTNDE